MDTDMGMATVMVVMDTDMAQMVLKPKIFAGHLLWTT
jgi:hypothetical protein